MGIDPSLKGDCFAKKNLYNNIVDNKDREDQHHPPHYLITINKIVKLKLDLKNVMRPKQFRPN